MSQTSGPGATRYSRGSLIALSAAWYVALCVYLLYQIHRMTGHFIFALDDPYIHLALSEQIAHGHYGINAGEASSPSSSVLWPFLLAPFARFSSQPLITLGINFLCGLLTAVLIGWAVSEWPAAHADSEEKPRRWLSAIGLVLIGNLAGLTFLGMEHTLQVLIAGACAYGVIAVLQDRPVPAWCLVTAAIAPAVRYEDLTLTVAVAIALWGRQEKRKAWLLLIVSLLPLIAFSIFLKKIGLPALPTSVLLKGGVKSANPLLNIAKQFGRTIFYFFNSLDHIRLLLLFLCLAGFIRTAESRTRRFALAGAVIAAGLHMLIGTFGWFHRYEVYIIFFSALIVLHVLHERPRAYLGWYALGLLGCCYPYVEAIYDTPYAAHDVYRQQYQMHRFMTEFATGNVAVNDLGLVSYQRRPGQKVVDLYGLGSVEASKQLDKSADWLDSITRRNDVRYVMIYPFWFKGTPADWTELGELCLNGSAKILGGDCVTYFATPLQPIDQARTAFADFTQTLPEGIRIRPPAPEINSGPDRK